MTDKKAPGGKLDWSAVNDEDTAPVAVQEAPVAPVAAAPPPRVAEPPRRVTLMDLATPLFGCAAMLPREAGAPQPSYQAFRGEVMRGLKRLETAAAEAGIERDDAQLAGYALCLFLDEQVAESEWTSRSTWATEPLHLVIQEDAAGGINFFRKLEALGERQRDVREVFLVCLALGFRGKYAELDTTQQAAELGAIRQSLVRAIQPNGPEKQAVLFPDAYRPAPAVAAGRAPVPRWWLWAGLGVLAACLVTWIALFVSAGRISRAAEDAVRPLVGSAATSADGRN